MPPISIHLPIYLYLFGNIPTNNYSPDGIAQSCSATWSRLLWSILERACIGAWNASGMISIIQMNVHIELDDHKHHPPAVAPSRGGWCDIPARSPSETPSKTHITRHFSNSEPFFDEHGDENFRPTYREFNFVGESPWRLNDRESMMEGNILFLLREGMSSARRSLILPWMNDKKKCQIGRS